MKLRVNAKRGPSWINARPHPNPLPQEEGTADARFRFAYACPPTAALDFARRRRTILPLPGGEGRGEGERFTHLTRSSHSRVEEGSLLIIVLWIAFGLVALTLYFAHSMSLELRASDNRVAATEAGQAIDGAARYLSNILGTVAYPGMMPHATELHCEAVPVGEAKFWLIGRETNDWVTSISRPAFGLVDEASKINLNVPWLTADMIQYLPGMTPQIAAAIMDWRDSDSTVSTDGAEDETYGRLTTPYKTKNAAFESVEELRLVSGMTAEILYGEDANLNGILDANENDADSSAPNDNRDGRLDPGLMEYFTVYSREPASGTNVNTRQNVQALLQDTLGQSRATEIMQQLFPSRPPRPGVPNLVQPAGSVLEFYLRSGMTEDEFVQVADSVTAATNRFTVGLVNVNTAKEPVLECIPGIGMDYAAQMISYRESNPSKLATVAWVADAIGETNAVIAGPYITTHSYQYTADIAAVGHHNRGYQRVRFVFDTSEGAPKVIHRQDLTHLGWALGKDTRTELLAATKEIR
jgi:type II secretory pathway component PulK